jgi:hypothetical protein
MPPIVIAGAIAAGGAVAGAGLESSAAGNAANIQSNAAQQAAALDYQAGQNALDFQQNEWNTTQAELAPYLGAGYGALGQLESGLGIPSSVAAPATGGAPGSVPPGGTAAAPITLNTAALGAQPAPGNLGSKLVSLATLGMFGGANPNQVPAASLEQSFEAAADNLNRLAKNGYITPAQAVQGMQALENSANSTLGGQAGKLGTPAAKAIANADKVIGNIIQADQGMAAPTSLKPENLSAESKLFIQPGTSGWYAPALTNSMQLTDQVLQQSQQPAATQGNVPLSTLGRSGIQVPLAPAVPPSGTAAPQGGAVRGTAMPAPQGGPGAPGSPAASNTTGALASQSLAQQWNTPFVAPTAEQAAATPGYQFQLQQGEQAMQRSAAAQGDLLTGGTMKDLNDYAQGVASENYQQVYNNALQQYQQAYNIFQNNQNTAYNRLAAMSGTGQTAAAQLGSAGAEAANTNASTNLGAASAMGNNLNNAAAATASGYVGSANALGSGISGGLGNVGQMMMLSSLAPQQSTPINYYSGLPPGTGSAINPDGTLYVGG